MKRGYLGDSYDAVKRMWQEVLANWAPLYADPRFLPAHLREEFTRLTRIPMLNGQPPVLYSILNDPDTGIRLPNERNQSEGRTHITIETIIGQLRNSGVACVITFDQSDYRNSGLTREQQRQNKMHHLANEGFHSFYYVSHAPFLFVASNTEALRRVRSVLREAGIPKERLEDY
jgi:hypothetical protein